MTTTASTTASTTVATARAALAVAVCALLAGCVQMPTEGPVEVPQVSTSVEDVPGISFDPRPPRAGEPAEDVVSGFLEAMKATPIRTTVARQFLSSEAAEGWVPEEQIITYAELDDAVPLPAPDGQTAVRIPMNDVNLYDARGSWQRTVEVRGLRLGLVEEDGEWRIADVPDALIVPDSWFDDWYQRVSLYFYDATSEVLVPEPVFAPRGDQLATSLVRGLLMRPSEESQDVSRTSFPTGTSIQSVPIVSGIADVALAGDPDAIDQETADRMLAQLVWTLRQEPRINAVQLTVGDRAFSFQGTSAQTGLDVGSGYDPSDLASSDLFALDRGRVVSGTIDAFEATGGPLGQEDYGVRSIGLNLAGSRVAAVSADGQGLLVAPVEAPEEEVTTVLATAGDLAAPSWDYRDRIWVLDRGAGRARVILAEDDAATEVDVPGLSGQEVTTLLVSRDGTRLVAVVRGSTGDRVVSTRVRRDTAGGVVGFTPLRSLALPTEGSNRVRDIVWRSPTTVSVLTSDINDDLSQVRTLSVDGSPGDADDTTRLRGRIRVLVSSPVAVNEVFALDGRTVKSLTRPERTVPELPRGLTSVTYPG